MGGSPHKLKNVKIPPPHRKLHQIIAKNNLLLFSLIFSVPLPQKKSGVSKSVLSENLSPHKILDLGKTWAFQFFSPSVPLSFSPSVLHSFRSSVPHVPHVPHVPQSFSFSVPQSLRHSALQSFSPPVPRSLSHSVLKSLCP